ADLPMDNSPAGDWPGFYATRRVLPFLRRARLPARDVALVERAVERFAEVAGPAEPPARIHGDLWSGNVLWSGGAGVLIDPAAHGGHRETDLAMLALFGLPYLDRVLGAYQEEFPLAPGWRERVPLHQLHPLLVHVVLYGGSYRDGLMNAVARVLSL
ncbi:MAG: phosphotransferase, partial [Nonomuraea sp.]|nr:phosphotransferase [Nonomuraea sp.]